MSDHVYRVIEVVGTSPDSIDAAIRNGVSRATQTLRNVDWFQTSDIRGQLVDGQIAHIQVTMKLGFRLDEDAREVTI